MIYQTIKNYSNYLFYSNGTIFNIKTGRFLGMNKRGKYLAARLTDDDGKQVYDYAHRWIYRAFKGEIPEGYTINHINEIKTDNRPQNLEAVTFSQNLRYGTGIKRGSLTRRIKSVIGKIVICQAYLHRAEEELNQNPENEGYIRFIQFLKHELDGFNKKYYELFQEQTKLDEEVKKFQQSMTK